MNWKGRILAWGRAYPVDRALEDSGFRESGFQETRKTKGLGSPGPL